MASDGGVFAYGDASFYGSMGGTPLNKPVVGIASTPNGNGYDEVASDGGIFSFPTGPSGPPFLGSTGSIALNKPVVGMAFTPAAQYYLVASDGGIFSFPEGPSGPRFYGSTGSIKLNQPVISSEDHRRCLSYLGAADGGSSSFPSSRAANLLRLPWGAAAQQADRGDSGLRRPLVSTKTGRGSIQQGRAW